MELENTEEKLCSNCRFFYKHYVNVRGKFKETPCGHCGKNINMTLNDIKKRIENHTPCKRWESLTEREEADYRYMSFEIKRIKKVLEGILQTLQAHENNY